MSAQDQFRCRQIQEFMSGRVSRAEAARILQLSERTVSRIASAVQAKGIQAVLHGNRGKAPHNRTDASLKAKVMKLVESKYYDFNLTHCREALLEHERIEVSYWVLRRWCHERQLVKRKKRRRAKARHLRTRMPAEGYLLQMDGSPHAYNGRDIWHLIHAIDDASSEIPYGEFFRQEGTLECMKVMQKIIEKKGIPRAVYTDRAGWSGGQKRAEFSQFKRACEELGIQVLFADSPEAKGRVERSFDTFQDRIIPEMRLRKITRMQDANRFLNEQFLPRYWNARNTVAPRSAESAYRTLHPDIDLDQIFCRKYSRKLSADHCFSWSGTLYRITTKLPYSLRRKRIEIRVGEDGIQGIYFEDRCLGYARVTRSRRPGTEMRTGPSYEQYLRRLDADLRGRPLRRPLPKRLRQATAQLRKSGSLLNRPGTKSLQSYRDKVAAN